MAFPVIVLYNFIGRGTKVLNNIIYRISVTYRLVLFFAVNKYSDQGTD